MLMDDKRVMSHTGWSPLADISYVTAHTENSVPGHLKFMNFKILLKL